jgi:hypothetical protein
MKVELNRSYVTGIKEIKIDSDDEYSSSRKKTHTSTFKLIHIHTDLLHVLVAALRCKA